jgi:hypothetical protein
VESKEAIPISGKGTLGKFVKNMVRHLGAIARVAVASERWRGRLTRVEAVRSRYGVGAAG